MKNEKYIHANVKLEGNGIFIWPRKLFIPRHWRVQLASRTFSFYTSLCVTVPDRNIRAQQARPLQLTIVNMERARMYVCIVAVLCVILPVMCICVIYKFLSLGL